MVYCRLAGTVTAIVSAFILEREATPINQELRRRVDVVLAWWSELRIDVDECVCRRVAFQVRTRQLPDRDITAVLGVTGCRKRGQLEPDLPR